MVTCKTYKADLLKPNVLKHFLRIGLTLQSHIQEFAQQAAAAWRYLYYTKYLWILQNLDVHVDSEAPSSCLHTWTPTQY